MKTKVELLRELGILDDIRQSFLRMDQNEPLLSYDRVDSRINAMTNDELIAQYARWEIGDSFWWNTLKSKFNFLEKHNPDEK